MLIAFCAVSFAQSAPKTAKKAMLLPANTQIKDLKTGQVVRVTKGTVPISTTNRQKKVVKMKMTRSGANTPTNSKKSNNIPVKQLPNGIKKLSNQ